MACEGHHRAWHQDDQSERLEDGIITELGEDFKKLGILFWIPSLNMRGGDLPLTWRDCVKWEAWTVHHQNTCRQVGSPCKLSWWPLFFQWNNHQGHKPSVRRMCLKAEEKQLTIVGQWMEEVNKIPWTAALKAHLTLTWLFSFSRTLRRTGSSVE